MKREEETRDSVFDGRRKEMETPFTTLLTKGETGYCSAPGLFQEATMKCVKREEKRSPAAITVRYEKKNSIVILEGFFS